jgi:P2 phage tail completion protein R (GpR)
MRKLIALRSLLTASPWDLAPDRIEVWVEDGTLFSRAGHDNRGSELSYRGHVLIRDYVDDVEPLFTAISDFMTQYEPMHADNAISWSADILDLQRADVKFVLTLTQVITVDAADAGLQLEQPADPDPEAI